MRIPAVLLALAACSSPATPDAPPSPWSLGPEMPGPRLESGVTALGQRVLVLGGFDQNVAQGLRITREVISLDPFIGAWVQLPEAPVAWTHPNVAGVGMTLYLLGGAEGGDFIARGDAFALDIDQARPEWRSLAPMPAGLERSAAGVVVAPPKIYLIGGASTTEAVDTVLVYDLSMNEWQQLPSLPAPRSHPAAMRMPDGTLIAAGGLATLDSTSASDEVWALRLGAPSWEPRAPMPLARGGCAYGEIFEQLVCAGGESGAAALSRVDRYDARTDTWSQLDDMPEPRAGTGGAVVGGRLYVPGGARTLSFQPTNTVFVLAFLEAIDS